MAHLSSGLRIAEGQLTDTPGDLRALIGRPTTSLAEAIGVTKKP
jgi:hypothetical protein